MRLRIPLIPLTFHITAEKRPLRRLTVLALMAVIAVLALGMGLVRLAEWSANDWAIDRQEVNRHAHEASFYSQMLQDFRVYQTHHEVWIIHGVPYRVDPDLDRYLEAMLAYHRRQAKRHEKAIGRWWAYVPPEPSPEPPPRVPVE
jgi:hypothetical protein